MGGGYVQPHVQLRSDINEVDFNQIIADENSNKPFIKKAHELKWINSASTYMTKYDASKPTLFGNWSGNTEITGLTEFRFFTNIRATQNKKYYFIDCINLEELVLPPNFDSLDYQLSRGIVGNTPKLKHLMTPNVFKSVGIGAKGSFYNSYFNSFDSEYVGVLNMKHLENINSYGSGQGFFRNCHNIETLVITPNITYLPKEFWSGGDALQRIVILGDVAPGLSSDKAIPKLNLPVYYPKGCNYEEFKKTYTSGKYIECDRDKFGNLVLPFRLKKYWEPGA